jgi:hypothetical protein
MSDTIEYDGRILDPRRGPRDPRRDLPAVTLQAAAEQCSILGIDRDANTSAGCMIAGTAWSFRRAHGIDRCLLLYGRIVRCQHDAIREEHLS